MASRIDPRIRTLLLKGVAAAKKTGATYAVGGALAMRAHGYARHTDDVDFFVMDEHRIALLRALREEGLVVEPVFSPHHYVATFPEHEDPDIRIDVLFPTDEPDVSAVEQPEEGLIEGVLANIFRIELLVASKFYSDDPKHHQDIAAMLERGLFEPAAVAWAIATYDSEAAEAFNLEIKEMSRRRGRVRPKRKPAL